jgi:polysaccharide pyruvyl transferase CsaB
MNSISATSREAVRNAFGRSLDGASRALIIGGYGCGNTGDEAILSSLLDDFRALDVKPVVVSARPSETSQMHEVEAIAASPGELLHALLGSEAVVIGGGGIFSAYMGRKSQLHPLLALAARALHKKVAFRALGVYPSTPTHVARPLALMMEHASFVSVRDSASIDTLRLWGVRRSVIREHDPAVYLQPQTHPLNVRRPAVGFALRRVRDTALQQRLRSEFLRAIDMVSGAGGEAVLIPFCAHPSVALEQDDAYARELASASSGRARVVPLRLTPAETLGAVANLDAIVGMRFHSIVFAITAGTHLVALPYDDKCWSFLSERRHDGIALVDVTADSLLVALRPVLRERMP